MTPRNSWRLTITNWVSKETERAIELEHHQERLEFHRKMAAFHQEQINRLEDDQDSRT